MVFKKQDGLALFFSLAFAISWAGWLGVLKLGTSGRAFLVLVALGPAAATVLAERLRRESSAWKTWHGLARWHAPALAWALALTGPIALLALGARLATSLDVTHIADLPASVWSWGYFAQCVVANPLEEIGWRGYALARLCVRLGP